MALKATAAQSHTRHPRHAGEEREWPEHSGIAPSEAETGEKGARSRLGRTAVCGGATHASQPAARSAGPVSSARQQGCMHVFKV